MKMKFLLPVLLLPLLVACGGAHAVTSNVEALSGATQAVADSKIVSRTLTLGSFSSIESNSVVDVIYTQTTGSAVKATLKGPANIVELCEIKVVDGILRINSRNGNNGGISLNGKKVTLTLSAPALSAVTLNGTGDFESARMDCGDLGFVVNGTGDVEVKGLKAKSLRANVHGTGDIDVDRLKCDKLVATLSGTGDIEIDQLSASRVVAILNGTGDIELSGQTGSVDYNLTGTGDIKAAKLKATDVKASNVGTGSIHCQAQSSISAKNTGTGSITYSGNPTKVDISKKGVSHK